eukprot:551820_1
MCIYKQHCKCVKLLREKIFSHKNCCCIYVLQRFLSKSSITLSHFLFIMGNTNTSQPTDNNTSVTKKTAQQETTTQDVISDEKSMNDEKDEYISSADMKKANPPKEKCNNKKIKELYNHQCNYHLNSDGSITFYPSPHLKQKDICKEQLATKKFLDSQKWQDIKNKIKLKELEAIYDFDIEIVEDYSTNICPFITGAIKAFNKHYPFIISPNNILLLVLQAIAVHV